jgi:hypothetical protein
MHGPDLASGDARLAVPCSPKWLLGHSGLTLRTLPVPSPAKPTSRNGLSLALSGCPITGPPLRGQRSRPASSTPRRSGFRPVQLEAPSPRSRFCSAFGGNSSPQTRCPHHLFGAPYGSPRLAPPRDFRSLGLNARPGSPRGKLASA